MKNNQENSPMANLSNSKKQALTPHQLVKRHMENPDEPITEEDMNNLDLSIQLPDNLKREADEEGDELEKDNTSTSYDVLDN